MSVRSLDDPPDDWNYWLTRPGTERFAAIERARQIAYGYDPDSLRLAGVYKVIERDTGKVLISGRVRRRVSRLKQTDFRSGRMGSTGRKKRRSRRRSA
jgi:hypothetical protein